MENQKDHVVIGITTCNRLSGLQRLLKGIEALRFVKITDIRISVVIVENGLKRGAEEIVNTFGGATEYLGYHYVHESIPGIPFARNAVLSRASELGATILAFIDDDEFPEAVWLDEALDAMNIFGAEVIAGPVLPVFPDNTPKWLVRGGGFHRDRARTGDLVSNVASGNVVFRLSSPKVAGAQFSEAYPLSGGTDTIFFRLLRRRGARMIWCDTAVAYEEVGENRATATAALRRAFRLGANRPIIEATVSGKSCSRFGWCFGGCGRILLGFCQCFSGLFHGRAGAFKGCRMIARGCGVFSGAFGHQFDEYKGRHR